MKMTKNGSCALSPHIPINNNTGKFTLCSQSSASL